jgi:D-threo-aldose 1-dehydrogenase
MTQDQDPAVSDTEAVPDGEPATRRLGGTDVHVTPLCVGTSPLGGMVETYGYDVDAERAVATVRRVLDSPTIRFLDTSNEYGSGRSEERIGIALAERGGLPEGFVLATKADPAPGSKDFSGARVLASFEESVARLGLDRVDVFHFHDPERIGFEDAAGPGGALEGLRRLKDDGRVTALGVAGWDVDLLRRYVDTGLFDVVLNHNRYTLLDQSASPLIDHALAAGLSFLNAAPYASGILAKPASDHPRYIYGVASDAVVEQTARLRALCEEHGVDLAAVALQFSTRDPRVTSTLVGVSRPERVAELERNAAVEVPAALWSALDGVLER